VVVLRGLPGAGKTVLAEQYASLFREAFTGRVIRLGPFGHHPPEEFLSQFHLALARAVSAWLSVDVSGIGLGRLRELVADRLTTGGNDVLLLVDDVPAGLPRAVLDQLLVHSHLVSTLITTRGEQCAWDAIFVDLPGLTSEDGLRLFSEFRKPADDAERMAVLRLVRRCGGHPFTLRANALAVRSSAGPLSDAALRALPDTAPQAIRGLLAGLSPLTRHLVRLGSVLAPVPFPAELAREVLGSPSAEEFTQAVRELAYRGFVSRVDGGLQFQTLVAEVAKAEFEPGELPERAGEVLRRRLREGHAGYQDLLLQHARVIAEGTAVHRIQLLRSIASAHEKQGDPLAAGEVHAMILPIPDAAAMDFTSAARVEIACGLYAEAVTHAGHAVKLADNERDRYSAESVAAQALDCQGDYVAAERVFWREHADRLPSGEDERLRSVVALAQARRLRGRPAEAVTLLETILPELGHYLPGDLESAAKLEYARSLQHCGYQRRAREVAAEIVSAYHAEGRERHLRCTEAELVHAEATLTLDVRDLRVSPADRERWALELRELQRTYERRHGSENPLTLTAAAWADRALLGLREPKEAMRALITTEQTVLRVLGEEHRLRYRIRHGLALALAQLREFGRQAELLESVLGPQTRMLGSAHPETLETRLDLGIALALGGRGSHQRAVELVDGAVEDIRRTPAADPGLTAKALAAERVVRLPSPAGGEGRQIALTE
jgi:tetratricopeptide (TPR) repeat protein